MKIKSIFSLVIIFCLLVSGCVYENKQRRENFVKRISEIKIKVEKGKSTKEDVLKILGDPVFSKNFDKWTYYIGYTEMTAWDFGGELLGISPEPTGESYTLYIYFDEDGIVKDYEIKKIR